jgi:PTH2 family peptidyl-tRNA hydrolase
VKIKQVIVIRADLKVRRGKEIAQGCHSSLAFLTRQLQGSNFSSGQYIIHLTDVAKQWIDTDFRKIVVRVDSEAELLEIESKAKEAGVECHLVTDNGLTEFHGIPTTTCLALGPDESEKIDAITGHLKLY